MSFSLSCPILEFGRFASRREQELNAQAICMLGTDAALKLIMSELRVSVRLLETRRPEDLSQVHWRRGIRG